MRERRYLGRRLAAIAAAASALLLASAAPAIANTAPSVSTSAGPTSYAPGGPAVVVDPEVTVTDTDSDKHANATIRIASNRQPGDELTLGGDTAGLNASWDASSGTLTLYTTEQGYDPSTATIQSALRNVRYAHIGTGVSGSKVVEFRVTDTQGASSAAASKTLSIPDAVHEPVDRDGDGHKDDVDCDDNEEEVHPGAREYPQNGVDDDCRDGDAPWGDSDGDGRLDSNDMCPLLSDAGDLRDPRDGCPASFGAGVTPSGGSDILTGTASADVICGLGGNDTLNGGLGNDTLFGDACNKKARVMGGAQARDGDDKLIGGEGADALYGAGGKDVLDGGLGNDKLFGGAGDDKLNGGAGRNSYKGGAGNDTIAAANGQKETVDCGAGKKDSARVDRTDKVKGCEKVKRAK